jgi:hypothetical protein
LVFVAEKIDGLEFVDVGQALSAKIMSCATSSSIAMISEDALNEILHASVRHNDVIGEYIAISNWGMLFEKALSFNLPLLFASLSQTRVLIAQNTGCVVGNDFFLAYPDRRYSFSLGNIQYYNAN